MCTCFFHLLIFFHLFCCISASIIFCFASIVTKEDSTCRSECLNWLNAYWNFSGIIIVVIIGIIVITAFVVIVIFSLSKPYSYKVECKCSALWEQGLCSSGAITFQQCGLGSLLSLMQYVGWIFWLTPLLREVFPGFWGFPLSPETKLWFDLLWFNFLWSLLNFINKANVLS